MTIHDPWRESLNEHRPDYILAIRAQALDRVQELIAPEADDAPDWDAIENTLPTLEVWRQIVDAAFPPPPIAGGVTDDRP